MGKRTKPQAIVVADLKQAEAALAEIAEIDRTAEAHEAAMNAAIDAARTEAKALCEPLSARRKELEQALATYAELNKADLFGKRKSVDLGFGTIGFRLSTSVKTAARTTWEMVLQKCKDFGFVEAVRTKESVDKDALRGWPDERLATVGARREVKDEFFIEINREAVNAAQEAA